MKCRGSDSGSILTVMLVFIDESGDSGMRFKTGSSEYFIIAAVVFTDRSCATACDRCIADLRRSLGITEFHFNKCSREYRIQLYEAVRGFDFSYSAFVMNKKMLRGPGFQHRKSFYKYPIRMACSNIRPALADATIILDRCGDRLFTQEVQKYLQQHANKNHSGAVKTVKSDRSHNNSLVQLADMVCGAVARSYRSDRKNRSEYRDLIRAREGRVQLWPK